MSHVAAATSQAFLLSRQQAEQDAARPDFQFWHEVFDQAHGSAADSPAQAHGDAGGAVHSGDSALRSARQVPFEAAMTVHEVQGARQAVQIARATPQATTAWPAGRPAVVPTTALVGVIAPTVTCAGLESGASMMAESSQAEALLQPQSSNAPQDKAEPDSAIRAHVMVGAEGELKVALRAQRGLSVSRALAAVAQAVHQAGESGEQVEQVVLNGKQIYQRVSERQTSAKASSTFELKC